MHMLNKPIHVLLYENEEYNTHHTDEVEVSVQEKDTLTSISIRDGRIYISQGKKVDGEPGYKSDLSFSIDIDDFENIQTHKGLPCRKTNKVSRRRDKGKL